MLIHQLQRNCQDALACQQRLSVDPNIARKSGGVFTSWGLAEEYSFTDIDGRRPNCGKYFAEHVIGQWQLIQLDDESMTIRAHTWARIMIR